MNTLLFIVVTAVFVISPTSTLLLVPVDGALFSSNKTSLENSDPPLAHVPEFIGFLVSSVAKHNRFFGAAR